MELPHRQAEDAPAGTIHVVFGGKDDGAGADGAVRRADAPDAPVPRGVDLAYPQQIHSSLVVPAVPGPCGEADGIWTERRDLALAVVTADCVPILLGERAGAGRLAAVHAGWRGLAAGIVGNASRGFDDPAGVIAWIGPAIGVAAYEVGEEVARKIAAAADESAVLTEGWAKPHVDLRRAAEVQLRAAGIGDVRHADLCTYEDERLWSYRRDGDGAGRNVSAIWRASDA